MLHTCCSICIVAHFPLLPSTGSFSFSRLQRRHEWQCHCLNVMKYEVVWLAAFVIAAGGPCFTHMRTLDHELTDSPPPDCCFHTSSTKFENFANPIPAVAQRLADRPHTRHNPRREASRAGKGKSGNVLPQAYQPIFHLQRL